MDYSAQVITYLLEGAKITTGLWLLTVLFSLPLALIVALIRYNNVPVLGKLLTGYTNLIRGTPLMLQLYIVYFVLPMALNIRIEGFASALVTFVISWVAYINEVLRIGLKSVEKWQYDSAKALGMSYMQTLWYIVLPQAFWRSSAGIANELVGLLYNTPLVAIIGLDELLKNAKVLVVRSFDFSPFLILAVFYLVFNSLIILAGSRIERRLTKFKLAENRS
jgi:polar amino acid transport system permease protein